MNDSILVISDLQIPAQHQDALDFLKEVKKNFKTTRTICIGDEVDFNALNFHQIDPDQKSARFELLDTIDILKGFYKAFPVVDVIESNHGALVKRRAKYGGLSSLFIRDMRDILEAPEGWSWHPEMVIRLSNGEDVKFIHGVESTILNAAKNFGMSTVQGHHHSRFELVYHTYDKSHRHIFGMTVGCLIDDSSPYFDYNKRTSKRPQLGCAVIKWGVPLIIPMRLDKNNRWVGKL